MNETTISGELTVKPLWLRPFLPAKRGWLVKKYWQAGGIFGYCHEARVLGIRQQAGVVVFELLRRRWEVRSDHPVPRSRSLLLFQGSLLNEPVFRKGTLFRCARAEAQSGVVVLTGGVEIVLGWDRLAIALLDLKDIIVS
jgi:hypothetical protein